jgi:hypothetical protein
MSSVANDKIELGIDEQLGKNIPLDVTFNDENGNPVTLRELINGPTVIALVYYYCPGICNPLMFELANVMNKSDLEPGYDYNVIAISIDVAEINCIIQTVAFHLIILIPSNGPTGNRLKVARNAFIKQIKPNKTPNCVP